MNPGASVLFAGFSRSKFIKIIACNIQISGWRPLAEYIVFNINLDCVD